ncbi:MAG: hypothetical protein LBR08_06510 [Bacteroidales bacterium]|nr:hypothetical protein [Bacteroidales bacterium]
MIKYENGDKDIFKEATIPVTTPQSVQAAQTVQADTLIFESYFFGHGVLDGNGKKLTKNEIQARFAKTPDALKSYKTGKDMLVAGNIGYGLGLFEAIFGVSTLASDSHYDDEQGKWVNSTNPTSVTLLVLGGATLIGSAILSVVGNSKIESAVKLYNKTARSGGVSSELSLNFGVTRSGGVGLTLNF